MKKLDDGGPAFPLVVRSHDGQDVGIQGMTLRDYFAAHSSGIPDEASDKVIAAYLGLDSPDGETPARERFLWLLRANAEWKYLEADAMLAERAKGRGPKPEAA